MSKKGGWKPPFPHSDWYGREVEYLPRPGLGLSPVDELFAVPLDKQQELRLVRGFIKRLAKRVHRVDSDGLPVAATTWCDDPWRPYLADPPDRHSRISLQSVQKRTLLERLPARVGGDVKSNLREVPSRTAVRRLGFGFTSGGKAPAVSAAHTSLLDGMGTGDCAQADAEALALAASESRRKRWFSTEVETDPVLWTDGELEASFAGDCERPFHWDVRQRAYRTWVHGDLIMPNKEPIIVPPGPNVGLKVRCRKCWPCQLARRKEWIARAINEARAAEKTWFLTGTFREKPEEEDAVVAEYQRYMKRLRNSGHAFKYLAVLERGEKNGRLHVHALIHGAMQWKDVHDTWKAGFAKVNQVKAIFGEDGRMDDASARQIMYIAGYVTGDIKFKVRASLRYGRTPPPQEQRRKDASLLPKQEAGPRPSLPAREARDPNEQA